MYPACWHKGRRQDGDPRVTIPIKGPASVGHLAQKVLQRRSTVRPSSFRRAQRVSPGCVQDGRVFLNRPPAARLHNFARAGEAPGQCRPSSRRGRRWVGCTQVAHAARHLRQTLSLPVLAWHILSFRECRGVADSGHPCGGVQRTDARHLVSHRVRMLASRKAMRELRLPVPGSSRSASS